MTRAFNAVGRSDDRPHGAGSYSHRRNDGPNSWSPAAAGISVGGPPGEVGYRSSLLVRLPPGPGTLATRARRSASQETEKSVTTMVVGVSGDAPPANRSARITTLANVALRPVPDRCSWTYPKFPLGNHVGAVSFPGLL